MLFIQYITPSATLQVAKSRRRQSRDALSGELEGYRLAQTHITSRKREQIGSKAEMSSLFVSEVFATAKVKLFATLIMMLLAKARRDVMFAHCAEGTTSFTQ